MNDYEQEEGWVLSTIKDFEEIVDKYGPEYVLDKLSEDTKDMFKQARKIELPEWYKE